MTNTHLEELLVDEPADTQAEIIRINTDARPLALQIGSSSRSSPASSAWPTRSA